MKNSFEIRNIAKTLNNIGLAYDKLGKKRTALKYYAQALPLRRALEHHRGEAITLHNIALVYDDLGEKRNYNT